MTSEQKRYGRHRPCLVNGIRRTMWVRAATPPHDAPLRPGSRVHVRESLYGTWLKAFVTSVGAPPECCLSLRL